MTEEESLAGCGEWITHLALDGDKVPEILKGEHFEVVLRNGVTTWCDLELGEDPDELVWRHDWPDNKHMGAGDIVKYRIVTIDRINYLHANTEERLWQGEACDIPVCECEPLAVGVWYGWVADSNSDWPEGIPHNAWVEVRLDDEPDYQAARRVGDWAWYAGCGGGDIVSFRIVSGTGDDWVPNDGTQPKDPFCGSAEFQVKFRNGDVGNGLLVWSWEINGIGGYVITHWRIKP